jgi:hypothetical protein
LLFTRKIVKWLKDNNLDKTIKESLNDFFGLSYFFALIYVYVQILTLEQRSPQRLYKYILINCKKETKC